MAKSPPFKVVILPELSIFKLPSLLGEGHLYKVFNWATSVLNCSMLSVDFDDNMFRDQLKTINSGDDVTLQVVEATSNSQQFGVGRKLVREITVLRGNEKLAGFGGLGQRPNPSTERAIETNSGSTTGGVAGSVLPGQVKGTVDTGISEFTGAAPCWNCEPQPGWGYGTQNKSDYGTDAAKPNLVKGLN